MADVKAEITANVWQVRVEVGQEVEADHELVILESMKMEIPVTAPIAGIVTALHVAPDDKVSEGDLIATVE
ncbi:MAG: biotin/lipoyl-binding carrier protein [Actinomycetia bacterium]|nr:biotin/lipoyl-binding carrier protein [Actinomycetes bacterium]MCP3911676.1 biotin/lipoyl-binding carrier protein [Actinomycetes bacterium]MCP4086945.1 biotin/lipoyl-binding carrier protein [Actinomycetes bacterium]